MTGHCEACQEQGEEWMGGGGGGGGGGWKEKG